MLSGLCEFGCPPYLRFVDLWKVNNCFSWGTIVGVCCGSTRCWGCFSGLFFSLYEQSKNYAHILVTTWHCSFQVHIRIHQGCPYFQILFVVQKGDTIGMSSCRGECSRFWNLRVSSLRFADDVVLLASSGNELQWGTEWYTGKCEVDRMRSRSCRSSIIPKKFICRQILMKPVVFLCSCHVYFGLSLWSLVIWKAVLKSIQ